MSTLAIIGSGGFGQEVRQWALQSGYANVIFYVSDEYCTWEQPLSTLEPRSYAVIAIGDPEARKKIDEQIHATGQMMHHTAITDVYSDGMILCPFSVISVNAEIGLHLHMNLHTDIGHDSIIGDYVTLSPGARVSGKCKIGNCVYIGSNAIVREKVTVCDNVTIGAGAVVLKDITEPGIYFGIPARKMLPK